ncbi:MAG TPA: DUF885 domain-containing protein [Candidatus Limnocylindria bacterium]|nr:DUF885 domain-containing protein [Candidatus Limnocylindria bacterium]
MTADSTATGRKSRKDVDSKRAARRDPNAAVNELADRFFEGVLERNPVYATILGDDRYDDRLPDLGADGRAADAAAYREVLAEAEAIDPERLQPEQVITRDMLLLVARNGLEALDRKLHQLAINHISGVATLPVMVAQYQVAESAEALEKLLTRFRAFPTAVEQYLDTLREGIADRRVEAAAPVRKQIEQIERMLELPGEQFPAVTLARVADDEARTRVRYAAADHVYPALRQVRDFLANEYEPIARPEPGLWGVPDGDEAYRLSIRMQTTVATSAEEVHAFGLEDLAHIEAEMDEIARSQGHEDRHAYKAALAADPANRTDSREALVRLAVEQTERAFAAAPAYFGRLPSANCVVLPVEEYRERETPPAFYMQPSVDGSRQGQYYINTYQPQERQLHKIAAITYHEATPGHHFQIGIEMELKDLPRFRILGSRMAGVAYVEGWGLYCERLADEMGLYVSEAERLGMLDAQAFRAARLVVDSGLHAMRWPRRKAIAFMHERGTLPMVDAEIEVDRYTIWPAQALAYKIGQREIERARREVSEKLGDRFDLRAFHDEVLAHGSLPLATLRREIPGWVEGAISAPAR